MSRRETIRISLVTVSALALFLGAVPEQLSWEGGMSDVASVYASGGKGRGGGGHDDGHEHDDGGGHEDDSHDHDDGDHDTHDHDDGDDGHSGGKKGKGPAYRGGRTATGKGRGGASHSVEVLIFEHE